MTVEDDVKNGSPAAAWSARMMTWVAIVAGAGAATSTYSLWHHLSLKLQGVSSAACNINATVNCDAVAQSAYSELVGIPLGGWGLAYFVSLLLMAILLLVGRGKRAPLVSFGSVLISLGLLAALVLAGISAVVIKALCLSCLVIYACNTALALIWFRERHAIRPLFTWGAVLQGAWLVLPAALIAAGTQQGLDAQIRRDDAAAITQQVSKPSGTTTLASSSQAIPVSRSAYSGLGEDYRRGSETAKVTVVVFSDFQRPACRGMAESLELLSQEYGERLQIVYRNYPLDQSCNHSLGGPMHQYACKLAVLARCAGQFGKFWDYHNVVFGRQAQIQEGSAEAWAAEIGLSQDDISACLASKSILEKVQDDIKLGNELNVDATPSVYLNGRKVYQNNIQTLRSEIDKLLQN